VRSILTGNTFLTEWSPLTGPMYQLFTFFMITDPKTTVQSRNGQIVVACLVAVVEAMLRLLQAPMFSPITGALHSLGMDRPEYLSIHAPYLALFIVGP